MKGMARLAVLAAVVLLAGCGQYDCSSADTKDLVRELLARGHEELVLHSTLLDTRIEGIVTEEANENVGWYACHAEIIADVPGGGTKKADLYYEVSQVDSADADLEVVVDREVAEEFAAAVRWSIDGR